MALGDYNNGRQNEKNDYRPSVYATSYINAEGKYEKTNLTFAIWKGMLKVTIAPKINGGSADDFAKFDRENAISIYLNSSKVKVLHSYLKEFIEAYKADKNVKFNKGVSANTGLVMISNSSYISGKGIPTITVIKPNENGIADRKYSYEIKYGSEFGIIDYDSETGKYETESDPHATVELELIATQLEQYIIGQTYGVAAACVDAMYFENNKIRSDIGKIAQKLGVDLYHNGGYNNGYTKNSYFNNGGSNGTSAKTSNSFESSSSTKTYEDIETAFMED